MCAQFLISLNAIYCLVKALCLWQALTNRITLKFYIIFISLIQGRSAKNASSFAPRLFILAALKCRCWAWEEKKKVSPFFCWKEWGMMGSVVGIRRQCWALNSKPSSGSEGGLLCSSESLFSGASHWDQSTFLPGEDPEHSKTHPALLFSPKFLFFWQVA